MRNIINIHKLIVTLLLPLSLICCTEVKEGKSVDVIIDSVEIRYSKFYSTTLPFVPVSCEDFDKNRLLPDTLIKNRKLLDQIGLELKNLKPDYDLNAINHTCFKVKIYNNNGSITHLCLLYPHAAIIYLNGVCYEYNPRLLYILKESSGYYKNMSSKSLEAMPELKDNTFSKDSLLMLFNLEKE